MPAVAVKREEQALFSFLAQRVRRLCNKFFVKFLIFLKSAKNIILLEFF